VPLASFLVLVPGNKYPQTRIKKIYGKTSVRVWALIQNRPPLFAGTSCLGQVTYAGPAVACRYYASIAQYSGITTLPRNVGSGWHCFRRIIRNSIFEDCVVPQELNRAYNLLNRERNTPEREWCFFGHRTARASWGYQISPVGVGHFVAHRYSFIPKALAPRLVSWQNFIVDAL